MIGIEDGENGWPLPYFEFYQSRVGEVSEIEERL